MKKFLLFTILIFLITYYYITVNASGYRETRALIMVDNTLYEYQRTNGLYRGQKPTPSDYMGNISKKVYNGVPKENGQTNVKRFADQPYTIKDDVLLIKCPENNGQQNNIWFFATPVLEG